MGGLPANPQRTTAWVWLFIALLGAGAMALPSLADIDMMHGGGALIMGGVLVSFTGVSVAVIYFKRARSFDRILSGATLLARWRYQPEEWARYTQAEHLREKSDKKGLFLLVAAISLVVGGVFFIGDREAGGVVFAVLLGVVALCGLAAVLSTAASHRRNRARVGEAFLSPSGVVLNGQLHSWDGLGSRLEEVRLEEGSPPFLQFTYSMPARSGRQVGSVRVPVPAGQEAAASGLAGQFQAGVRTRTAE